MDILDKENCKGKEMSGLEDVRNLGNAKKIAYIQVEQSLEISNAYLTYF